MRERAARLHGSIYASMRWLACLAALLFSALSPAPSIADESGPVVVRTSVQPDSGAVIGQHVALLVDVLFRDGMTHPPRVEIPEVAGAQVMRFETQGLTTHETIDGKDYVGQRFEFAVFPRRGGEIVVPAATVTLLDKQGGETGKAKGEPVRFTVTVPPGIDASAPVVATDKMTLQQDWSPDGSAPLAIGGAVVRTITRKAGDLPGLAMRDLAFAAPEGVKVYADAPQINDKVERGVVTGERVDRATYVFQRAGTFELPAISQPWWNLRESSVETAAGDALKVTVTGAATTTATGTEAAAPLWRQPSTWATGAAILIAIIAAWTFLPRLAAGYRARRRRYDVSEEKAFRDLIAACRHGDAKIVYRRLTTWRSFWPHRDIGESMPSLERLEAALFGNGTAERGWSSADGRELGKALEASRSHWRMRRRPASPEALPALNPAGDASR